MKRGTNSGSKFNRPYIMKKPICIFMPSVKLFDSPAFLISALKRTMGKIPLNIVRAKSLSEYDDLCAVSVPDIIIFDENVSDDALSNLESPSCRVVPLKTFSWSVDESSVGANTVCPKVSSRTTHEVFHRFAGTSAPDEERSEFASEFAQLLIDRFFKRAQAA